MDLCDGIRANKEHNKPPIYLQLGRAQLYLKEKNLPGWDRFINLHFLVMFILDVDFTTNIGRGERSLNRRPVEQKHLGMGWVRD